MRRFTFAALLVLAIMALVVPAAWAGNPHFVEVTATVSGNTLTVSGKEAGLGDDVRDPWHALPPVAPDQHEGGVEQRLDLGASRGLLGCHRPAHRAIGERLHVSASGYRLAPRTLSR